MKPKIVRITVGGGVIQDIDLPKGVVAVVQDYDVDGVDSTKLKQDENGEEFFEATWE